MSEKRKKSNIKALDEVKDKMGWGKPSNHDLGCEIQHTGKCNCKDPNYELYKSTREPKDGKINVAKIPF